MKRRRFIAGVAAASVALPAFAVDYLTTAGAQRALFPDADAFAPVALDRGVQALKLPAPRAAMLQAFAARKGNVVVGYVVTDAVVGKFELIGYAVGLSPACTVTGVEILWYRESHGYEVRQRAWREQFVGKTAASPMHVDDDIRNISGATLSTNHVTDGVRLIVQVAQATFA